MRILVYILPKKKDSGLHSSENDMRLVIEKELHYILRISGPRLTGAACLGAYSGSSAITVPDGVLRVPSAAICFDLESHVLGTCEPQRLCVVLGACRKRRWQKHRDDERHLGARRDVRFSSDHTEVPTGR